METKLNIKHEEILTITLTKDEWIKLKLALYECRWGEPNKTRATLVAMDNDTNVVPPEWRGELYPILSKFMKECKK